MPTAAQKLLRFLPPALALAALGGVCAWQVDRIAARSQGYEDKKVVLNEICAHNLSGLQDGNGSCEDWIELYNPYGGTIDLSGWTLTDDKDDPDRWTFPAGTTLEEYRILFADGTNTVDAAGYLHTSFSLKTRGETLYLYDADGELVDYLKYPKQNFDITYGRAFGNGSDAGSFATATPGAANPVDFLDENREAPLGTAEFSLPAGFYDEPVAVALSAEDPDALIFYTTDGSDPAENGKLYTGPITVESRVGEPNEYVSLPNRFELGYSKFLKSYAYEYAPDPVDKATTITTRLYKDGKWSEDILASTYWIDVNAHTLPVVSITADPNELFGNAGIYSPGFTYYTLTRLDVYGYSANFMSGEKISAQVQTLQKGCAEHLQADISVAGESSRLGAQMKNLLVEIKKRGNTSLLKAGKNADSLEDISLKGPGNGTWKGFYLDGFWNNYLYNCGLGTQYNVPVILYLEDEYWGLYCARERKDEAFVSRQYDVNQDSVELARYNSQTIADLNNALLSLEDKDVWEWVLENFDLDEYIDYLIACLYSDNGDAIPTLANTIIWRATQGASKEYSDGKWRFVLNDFDMTIKTPENDPFISLLEQEPEENNLQHVMLQKLWNISEFRNLFSKRFREAMETTYAPENILPAFETWCAKLEPEMERNLIRQKVETNDWVHLADWLTETTSKIPDVTMETWKENYTVLCDFFATRASYMLEYLDLHLQETNSK